MDAKLGQRQHGGAVMAGKCCVRCRTNGPGSGICLKVNLKRNSSLVSSKP